MPAAVVVMSMTVTELPLGPLLTFIPVTQARVPFGLFAIPAGRYTRGILAQEDVRDDRVGSGVDH